METTTTWVCPRCETENSAETTVCTVCGGVREAVPDPPALTPLPPIEDGYSAALATANSELHKLKKKLRLRSVLSLLLLLCACVWGGVMTNRSLRLSETLSETALRLDAAELRCEELTADKENLQKQFSDTKSELTKANSRLSDWKRAAANLMNAIPGYADQYFHVDKGVLCLNKGASRKLTLTTAMAGYNTISYERSGYAATVSFDQNNWYNSTTLTVKGSSEGLCILTFSASNYNKTFKVLVVVS